MIRSCTRSPPETQEHLWIVLTNPDQDESILIVNVTTAHSLDKDKIDSTIMLKAGEHKFLTSEKSYIYYRGAQIKKVSELQVEEKLGRLKMHEPCSNKILGLARSGVNGSKHCSRVNKRFYAERKDIA